MTCRIALYALLVAGSILSAPAHAAAPGGCKLVRVAEWPVQVDRNRLVVQGAINGKPVGIMLDTGTSRTLISRAAANRLGLTRQTALGHRVFGVGGESYAEMAYVDEFRIGEAVRRNWTVLVAGELEFDDRVAVLLGEDLFENFELEFDLPSGVVRLHQSRECGGVALAYWTRDVAGEIAIESGPKIHLTVKINGQPVRALLDSGAGSSILAADEARRLGVTRETPGVVSGGCRFGLGQQPVDAWIGRFQRFEIGNELIHDTALYFSDLWKHTTVTATGSRLPQSLVGLPQMLLGADFLRAHRLLIAYSQRKVYFTYVGGTVFPTREATPCSEQLPRRP